MKRVYETFRPGQIPRENPIFFDKVYDAVSERNVSDPDSIKSEDLDPEFKSSRTKMTKKM